MARAGTGPVAGARASQSEVALLQRYTVIGKQGQLSEDQSAAVSKQALYATEAKIKESNQLLGLAGPHGSMVKLTADGDGIETPKAPGKRFFNVEPGLDRAAYAARMRSDRTSFHQPLGDNSEGTPLKIWADCRRASEVVTGASSSMGKHDRRVRVGGDLAEGYKGSIERASGVANDSTTARLSFQVYAKKIGPFMEKRDYNPKALFQKSVYKQQFPDAPTKVSTVRDWAKGMGQKAIGDIEIAEKLYTALTPRAKTEFHKETGTNEFADPMVGDAYATVTEYGMPGFKESGDDWAFHWGGVVMKAGSDNVTLENLSVSDELTMNTKWFFAMYGTAQKEQTFHHRQSASGHHGNVATTISVVTEGSTERRRLQSAKDKLDGLKDAERRMGVDFRPEMLRAAANYNRIASTMGEELLTEYVVLGRDRSFTTEDKRQLDARLQAWIPKAE